MTWLFQWTKRNFKIVIGFLLNFLSQCQLFVNNSHTDQQTPQACFRLSRVPHTGYQGFYILVPRNLGANISRLPTVLTLQHLYIGLSCDSLPFHFLFSFPPAVRRLDFCCFLESGLHSSPRIGWTRERQSVSVT